jgi:hypothetical protein
VAVKHRQSGTAALVVLGLIAFITAAVPMHWIAVVHVNWFARFSTANSKAQPLPSSPPVVFLNRIEASTRPPPQGSRKWQAMSLREQALLMLHGLMTYPHSHAGWEVDRRHTSPHSTDFYRRPATVEAYLGLMEAYRPGRQWYFVVDALYGVGCGAVFGAAWATNIDLTPSPAVINPATSGGCDWVLWVTLAFTAVALLCLAGLRPFLAHYDFVVVCITAAFSATAVSLQIGGYEDAADAIVVTQLALGLLFPVVQLLRLALLGTYLVWKYVTSTASGILQAVLAAEVGRLGGMFEARLLQFHRQQKHQGHDVKLDVLTMTALRRGTAASKNTVSAENQLSNLVGLICKSRKRGAKSGALHRVGTA